MASHRSAARLWGVSRPDDDPVDLLSPAASARRSGSTASIIHRTTDGRPPHAPATLRHPVHQHPSHIGRPRCSRPDGVSQAVGHALGDPSRRSERHSKRLSRRTDDRAVPGFEPCVAPSTAGRSTPSRPTRRSRRRCELWSAATGCPPVEFHPVIEGHEVDFRVVGTPADSRMRRMGVSRPHPARTSSGTAIATRNSPPQDGSSFDSRTEPSPPVRQDSPTHPRRRSIAGPTSARAADAASRPERSLNGSESDGRRLPRCHPLPHSKRYPSRPADPRLRSSAHTTRRREEPTSAITSRAVRISPFAPAAPTVDV